MLQPGIYTSCVLQLFPNRMMLNLPLLIPQTMGTLPLLFLLQPMAMLVGTERLKGLSHEMDFTVDDIYI
jgi:hypothetical protein